MPPALSDSLVGWASGPVGAERKRDLREDGLDPKGSPNPTTRARGALETLLVDLGPQIQRGSSLSNGESNRIPSHTESGSNAPHPSDVSRVCATGLTSLDTRLGGGFPRGHLSEICGPPSSGRTALALKLIDTTLQRGGLAGWIDLADAFDPLSASTLGAAFERLLWIRPRCENEALRSCDRLLQTEGFELVVFDCISLGARKVSPNESLSETQRHRSRQNKSRLERSHHHPISAPSISNVAWLRLSRLAAKTRTTLIVLSQTQRQTQPQRQPQSQYPLQPDLDSASASIDFVSMTGARAAVVLEMIPLSPRFVGSPSLLDSLETTAVLRRHRTRPIGAETSFSVPFSLEDDLGIVPEVILELGRES